jgi:ABC-type phosphate transport system substrate-binding protein
MKIKRMESLFLLIAVSLSMSFVPYSPTTIEVAVVINAENPVNKMEADFVKNYWLRRFVKRWKEINKGILPTDRKSRCAEQEIFYNQVLGLPTEAVETYLTSRQYQNGDNPPVKLSNDAEIIEYVGREAGAIGYVNAASISARDKSVKVILLLSSK